MAKILNTKKIKIPLSLQKYIVKQYVKSLLMFYFAISLLIFIIDFTENFRKYSKNLSYDLIILLSLTNIPTFLFQLIPFIILFASLNTLRSMSLKNEIDIYKSFGISIWKILIPFGYITILLGIINAFVISSVVVLSSNFSNNIQNSFKHNEDGQLQINNKTIWFIDRSNPNKKIIIIAKGLIEDKNTESRSLTNINILEINTLQDELYRSISADIANIQNNSISLENAFVKYKNEYYPNFYKEFTIDNFNFRTKNINQLSQSPELTFIWQLPSIIKTLNILEVNTNPYKLYLYNSLFTFFLLLAMLFFSTRYAIYNARGGKNLLPIILAITTGFIVYFIINLTTTLGLSGTIPPIIASLIPQLLVLVFAIHLLFLKEGL